ncbi:MAG: NYN domain-containing protein [Planctomycetota bacterium]
MIFFSASSTGGGSRQADLHDLSPDDLIRRIEELDKQVESMRARHQAETKRSMETVERLQKAAAKSAKPKDESAPDAAAGLYTPVHSAADGYDVLTQQRVAVLVDVQNMYYAARNLHNSKLEFSKLLRFASRNRRLTRALAYIVERPGMEQDKFVEVLRRNGFEVRKKVLIERSDGSQKGDWDLGIALDAVALSDKVDVVVLVTGDGDFVTLVHFLHSRGIRVEVASFPETTALELIRSCDYYHRLNDRVLLPTGQFPATDDKDRAPDRRESGERREAPERRESSERRDRPTRSKLDEFDDDDEFRL